MNGPTPDGIAIIGLAGKFPGAANVNEFWRNLAGGVESISTFSDEELAASGMDVEAIKKEGGYVASRGILKDAEWFDAAFFGMNPKEAEVTDPQQRIFLETAWEALEDAGCDPAQFRGAIGVYAGMGNNTYYLNHLHSRPDLIALAGWMTVMMANEKDFLATRVAYKLNLKGPAISVNTACSTSLVAVCQACQSLLNFQCDVALAGGISITFPQRRAYRYQDGGIVSPDGHCRAFDAQAKGTVSSDGAGIVVLKRLAEALDEGDQIYAVIKGFGVNNDGSGKVSFGSPSVDGQAEAIALAMAQAGFDPSTISCVEAHGTGTPLGDPIEIAGLSQAFSPTTTKNFCAIGSVKSNIGHLDTAAGVAGLIKMALAMKNKLLPGSLNYERPNPQIDFANSPFYVNTALTEWKEGPTPRRAGVSSFGLGGTNAHVVLEEAPQTEDSGPSRDWQLLVLSAKTNVALDAATGNLIEHLKANPGINFADTAFTLQSGRAGLNHRRMLVCRDAGDAITALESRDAKRVLSQNQELRDPPVVFMFPGQGAQYVNMGAELYRAEPAFKEEVDRCAEFLQPHLGMDIRRILFPSVEETKSAEELLIQTRITQPALFVIEYALAKLWMSWGVRPRAMIGHSVGEYVAGCLAGVFSLEDSLELVAARARMVQSQPGGAMLAVRLPEKEIAPLLRERISLAAINSPGACVVSGPYEDIEGLEKELGEKRIASRRLQTSHAFHSAMLDPVIKPFTELLRRVKLREPGIPCISNVTGQWVTSAQAMDPKYWASHMREPVRFADGVGELLKDPQNILLEAGPGQTLSALARQHPPRGAGQVVLSSFSAAKEGEFHAMLNTLGKLWLNGMPVNWEGFHKHEKRRRISLPAYPFERKRFTAEPGVQAPIQIAAATLTEIVSSPVENQAPEMHDSGRKAEISMAGDSCKQRTLETIMAQLRELSGKSAAELPASATFAEMGFDSLFLAQASHAFEKQFGVLTTFRQLMGELSSPNELAEYFDKKMFVEFSREPAAKPGRSSNEKTEAMVLPLTEAQLELWLATRMGDSASCAFNQIFAVHLRGALELEAFREAAQEFVGRHDALRATFLPDGSGQRISSALKLDIPLLDLSAMTESEGGEKLVEAMRLEDRTPFDLANGPLLRVRVVKLSGTHHAAIIAGHHIVMDGWSMAIALHELGWLYSAKIEQGAGALPPAMQFSEYVRWHTAPENRGHFEEVEAWWLLQFAEPPGPVELPCDRPRPAVMTYRARRETLELDAVFYRTLKQAAARDGCTLFTYLLASFNVLLYRLTGQEDLTVGIPAAGQIAINGQLGRRAETLVGHCVNLLPFRNRCDGGGSFRDYLKTVKRAAMDAFEHQDFTFCNLVKKLKLPRDSSRLPLLSATFNFSRGYNDFQFHGMESELMLPARGFNMFDLTIDVLDSEKTPRINCHFSADLFDAGTVRRWLCHWKTLLEGMAAKPEQRVAAIPMLTETERRHLMEWNETQSDFPKDRCVHELVEAQAESNPQAIAVVFEEEQLTYGELNRRANRVAWRLKERGIGPGMLAGLCVERSLKMVVGLLGILKAGAAYVPLDPSYPRERMEFILQDARAAVVLAERSTAAFFENSIQKPVVIYLDADLSDGRADESILESGVKPEDLAYVLYTSGSTGKPKGVQISHRALVNFLSSMRREPGLEPSDILLAVTTLSFDIAGLEIWLPLTTGARVVIAKTETAMNGRKLAAQLAQSGATVMQGTPVTWRLLLEAGWVGNPDLKILCGGEAWTADLARDLLPRCGSLWNMYGPTETTIWSAATQIIRAEMPVIGRPIANTTFYVLDGQLQAVPIGVTGELHIGGAGRARGYLGLPELTAERFIADPFSIEPGARLYKTGDLVRRRMDGRIEFLGRMDQQVKIRGYRIELGEIEAALRQHPNVSEAAVAAQEDGSAGKRLAAYVTARRQPSPTAAELREFLGTKLPEYMTPTAFVMLEALPLTPNGKVDRKALPQPNARLETAEFTPPRTAAELAVAELWREVLGLKEVGVHDDFFELGGHSLAATQLISRLEKFHGLELSLRDVFDAPTIAEMSRWLEEEEAEHPEQETPVSMG